MPFENCEDYIDVTLSSNERNKKQAHKRESSEIGLKPIINM